MVLTECKFLSAEENNTTVYKICLNDKSIGLLINDLKNTNYYFIIDVKDAENKHFFIKILACDKFFKKYKKSSNMHEILIKLL